MLRQLSLAALLSLYLFVSSNRRDKPNTALLALRVQRSSPATPSVRKPLSLSHKDAALAVFCHGSKVRGRSRGSRCKAAYLMELPRPARKDRRHRKRQGVPIDAELFSQDEARGAAKAGAPLLDGPHE